MPSLLLVYEARQLCRAIAGKYRHFSYDFGPEETKYTKVYSLVISTTFQQGRIRYMKEGSGVYHVIDYPAVGEKRGG